MIGRGWISTGCSVATAGAISSGGKRRPGRSRYLQLGGGWGGSTDRGPRPGRGDRGPFCLVALMLVEVPMAGAGWLSWCGQLWGESLTRSRHESRGNLANTTTYEEEHLSLPSLHHRHDPPPPGTPCRASELNAQANNSHDTRKSQD